MKTRPLFIIQGALSALFGVMFLAVPTLAMDTFVGTLGVTDSFYTMTRMIGGSSVVFAIILFGALRFEDIRVKRLLALAMVVYKVVSVALHAYGVLIEAILPAGWIMVGVDGVLALLFASTFLTKEP